MRKHLLFAVLALALLTPWPVAYAYENNMAGAAEMRVDVTAAPDAAAPRCNVYGKAIGSVTSGDLFYIDSSDYSVDSMITLLITNADELSRCYRYMTLRVGVYVQTGENQWRKLTEDDGVPETYITLKNGSADFRIQGYAQYKIAIDGGCFYCFTANAEGGNISPDFYLTVE